jgi:hypothetical protein
MNKNQLRERLSDMAFNVDKLNTMIGILAEELTGKPTTLVDIVADYGHALKDGIESLLPEITAKGGAQDE